MNIFIPLIVGAILKKIAIIDSCDFFSENLKDSLLSKLKEAHAITTINPTSLEYSIPFFDYYIFGVNNNSENEFILVTDIKNKYYHANILIVAQDLTLEGIKRLKSIGINAVLLKPVNTDQVIERLKK